MSLKTLLFSLFLFTCQVTFSQNINVEIDYSHPGIKIPSDFTGISFETRSVVKDNSIKPENTALLNMMKLLGDGVLRIGGNSVQSSVFTFSKRNKSTGQDSITADDIDRVFAFANQLGWKVIFGLNQGKYNPKLAAIESQYLWKYSSQIHSLEIGNEPNHFIMHNTRDSSWGYPEYKTEFEAYVKAISEIIPDVRLSGPATASNYKPWLVDFAKDESKNVVVLSHHNYPMSPQKGSIEQMLSKKLMKTSSVLFSDLVSVAAGQNKKFRLAECNSVYNGGLLGVSNSFASALWGADYMFNLAKSGAVGLNFHTGATNPYTPIAYAKNVYTAKPLFYGMLLFAQGGNGSFLPINISDTSANVSYYAVKESSGHLALTIINKDTLKSYTINASLIGTSNFKECKIMRLTAQSVSATTDVLFGGGSVNSDGTWVPKANEVVLKDSKGNFIITVAAGSAASVRFSDGSSRKQ